MQVRMGKTVSFGRFHWKMILPNVITTGISLAISVPLSTQENSTAFFVALTAYILMFAIASSVVFACLVGNLMFIYHNVQRLEEVETPRCPTPPRVEQPRPTYASSDIARLRGRTSWLTSTASSRLNPIISAFSFSLSTKDSRSQRHPSRSNFAQPSKTSLAQPSMRHLTPCAELNELQNFSPQGSTLLLSHERSEPSPLVPSTPTEGSAPSSSHYFKYPAHRAPSATSHRADASFISTRGAYLQLRALYLCLLLAVGSIGSFGEHPWTRVAHPPAQCSAQTPTRRVELQDPVYKAFGWFALIWVPTVRCPSLYPLDISNRLIISS